MSSTVVVELGGRVISGPQEILWSRYNRLSSVDQQLLVAMAVFSAPVSGQELYKLAEHWSNNRLSAANKLASVNMPTERALKNTLLPAWKALGLVDAIDNGFMCTPDCAALLLDYVLDLPQKRHILTGLEAVFDYEDESAQALREWRGYRRCATALLLDDPTRLMQALEHLVGSSRLAQERCFKQYFHSRYWLLSVERLSQLSLSLQAVIIHLYLGTHADLVYMHKDTVTYISQFVVKAKHERQSILPRYLQILLMMGQLENIDPWLEIVDADTAALYSAWKGFLCNRGQEALIIINAHQRVITKQKNPQFHFSGLFGVFYLLALMQQRQSQLEGTALADFQQKFNHQIQRAVALSGQDPYALVQLYLYEIDRLKKNNLPSSDTVTSIERWLQANPQHPAWSLQLLVHGLQACWLQRAVSVQTAGLMLDFLHQLVHHGSVWLAAQLAAVIEHLAESSAAALDEVKHSRFPQILTHPVLIQIKQLTVQAQQKNWLLLPRLFELPAIKTQSRFTAQSTQAELNETRLTWVLSEGEEQGLRTVSVKEQKLLKNGWSRGKTLSIKDLIALSAQQSLSVKDQQLVQALLPQGSGYEGYAASINQSIPVNQSIVHLIGHPLLFAEKDLEHPLTLIAAKPKLVLRKEDQSMRILLDPYPQMMGLAHSSVFKPPIVVQKKSAHLWQLIQFQAESIRVAHLLGAQGLLVPLEAQTHILQDLNVQLACFTLHSEMQHGDELLAELIPADTCLHVLLTPMQQGLAVDLYVQPFAEIGPQFPPGQGLATVMIDLDGRLCKVCRDLPAERRQVARLIEACGGKLDFTESMFYQIDDLEQAYELLLLLQDLDLSAIQAESQSIQSEPAHSEHLQSEHLQSEHLQSEQIQPMPWLQLHWPEGKALRLLPEINHQQLSLQIEAKQNWFELTGELQVDAGRRYSLPQLAALLESSASGRFIKLDDQSILVLTQQLKKKLQQWRAYTDEGRFHALASPALENILEDVSVENRALWQQQMQRFLLSQQAEFPLPEDLQAQLRDYQKQGFQWLMRLAEAGIGACLADDMGLGKTVQTLAVLLARASQGPALIVAPKSVCINWLQEIQRFAPHLSAKYFQQDPQAGFATLGAFSVVVCSYGLLQSHLAVFDKVSWHTLVIDEAQAIKNMQAKRTKSVLSLRADFKLALTGTPIENHLGDLWTLFRFINPGLLGSLEAFNRRFVLPIEQRHDLVLQRHLQTLIKPFLLRRLKRDVLTELPSRTEITVDVVLSDAEMALYEALRRQAVDSLASSKASLGQKRVQIFAELMRLRRACCHPAMVMPQAGLTSSKLSMLMTLVDELLLNQHKALVFSQFVDHLQLIKAEFDRRNIHYQYLDGSTSTRQREQAVSAFQAGQGDIFLISLKAGGVGLNLTAADYVIHMDPWWNPAVEDQASDRAHRIGQLRPVTIYRLVTTQTIEQKIMALHGRKRDLANSLLAGTDSLERLSFEDMRLLLEQ